jgi:hypothetical protein
MAGEVERLTEREVRALVDEHLSAESAVLRPRRPSRNLRFGVWVVDVGDEALPDEDHVEKRLVVTDAGAVYETSPDQGALDDLMLALGLWPGADPADVFGEEDGPDSSGTMPTATTALVMDVDGVVSPVHPQELTWGDEVQAGVVFGPVQVSPSLCRRLERLGAMPFVAPAWLTSWNAEMRRGMEPWFGKDWPEVGSAIQVRSGRVWWKRAALERWLDEHPYIDAVVWCDDHLESPVRRASITSRLELRGVDSLLIAPKTAVGLTPKQVATIENWLLKKA